MKQVLTVEPSKASLILMLRISETSMRQSNSLQIESHDVKGHVTHSTCWVASHAIISSHAYSLRKIVHKQSVTSSCTTSFNSFTPTCNPMCLKPGPADITSFPPLQVELPVAKGETQIGLPIKYITYLMTDLLAGQQQVCPFSFIESVSTCLSYSFTYIWGFICACLSGG